MLFNTLKHGAKIMNYYDIFISLTAKVPILTKMSAPKHKFNISTFHLSYVISVNRTDMSIGITRL